MLDFISLHKIQISSSLLEMMRTLLTLFWGGGAGESSEISTVSTAGAASTFTFRFTFDFSSIARYAASNLTLFAM